MKNILKVSLITILSIFLFSCADKKTDFEINGVWTFYDYDKVYNEMFNEMSSYRDSHDKADVFTNDFIKDHLNKELDITFFDAFVIENNVYISVLGSENEGTETVISPITIEKGDGYFSFTPENEKQMRFNIIDDNTIQLADSDTKAFRVKTKSKLGFDVDRKFLTGTWEGDYRVMFNNNLMFGEDSDGVHTHKDLVEGGTLGMAFDFFTFDLNESTYFLSYKKGEYERHELIKFIDYDNFVRLSSIQASNYSRMKDK